MSRISVDIYTPTDPRLGRQVEHDERSRRFALFPKDTKPQGIDTHWLSHAGPLNQGQIGSCTTNALSQWLNTDFAANILTAKHHGKYMTEAEALELYKMATRLDAIPGFYPEEDTGSTGNAACKAGMKAKLLQAYSWVFSFSSTQATLEKQPVMLGTLWTNCVIPETKVLTTNLEWVQLNKIKIGDELIGFDENIDRECAYHRSRVLANKLGVLPCVEIETDRGSIVASNKHLFIQRHEKADRHWILAEDLEPGDQIMFWGEPYEEDKSWEAGWLAGFYDGEGCLSKTSPGGRDNYLLTCSQKEGPEMDLCLKLLEAKGFDYGIKLVSRSKTTNSNHNVYQWYLRGPNARTRFLGQIRPQRLLANSKLTWEDKWVRRKGNYVTIQSVTNIGKQEIMGIRTSTGTLITEGFLSHNSMFKPNNGLVKVGPLTDQNIAGGHEYLGAGIEYKNEVIVCRNSWGDKSDWPGCKPGGYFAIGFSDFKALLEADGDVTIPH